MAANKKKSLLRIIISHRQKKTSRTSLASLAGSLADSKNLAVDAVTLVRQWRDEW